MADDKFPPLDPAALDSTRQAVQSYARVAGAWCKATRRKRKHWWHASLRPSLFGLTSGVIYGATDVEIELDLTASRIQVRTGSSTVSEGLLGQSSGQIAKSVRVALVAAGIDESLVAATDFVTDESHPGYSADQARLMHRAIGSVTAVLEDFRAGIREETSPIQVWPHHFDLSMIWLPGSRIAGQDPDNEEYADKQMNFGFAFGDDAIPEPYFYVTAYPLPEALPAVTLPKGTVWRSDGFSGAVLLYQDLAATADPAGYLLDLWGRLLAAGREDLCSGDEEQ